MSLTAVHCAKTLIVASTSGNPMLRQCAKLLFPGLIEYIAKMAPLVNDNTVSELQGMAIGEVWKAFSAFFASVPEEHRTSDLYGTEAWDSQYARNSTLGGVIANYHPPSFKHSNTSITRNHADHLTAAIIRNVVAIILQGSRCKIRPAHPRTSGTVDQASRRWSCIDRGTGNCQAPDFSPVLLICRRTCPDEMCIM